MSKLSQLSIQDEEEEEEDDVEGDREEDEPVEDYFQVLSKLSEKWLETQLTHHVSATASNTFWAHAMESIPDLIRVKTRDNILRKTPGFTQERRKLHEDRCPKIHMKFGFKHKQTGAIETVDSQSAPMKQFQRNPDYVKVFEEAYIEVSIYIRIHFKNRTYIYIYNADTVSICLIVPVLS